MSKPDPRVDAFIAKAPEFAQPILREYRKRVHEVYDDVTETIKWNVPFFLNGEKIVASMAAFKKHTKLGVWLADRGMGTPKFFDAIGLDQIPSIAEIKALIASALGGAPAKKKAAPKKKKKTAAKKKKKTTKAGAKKKK